MVRHGSPQVRIAVDAREAFVERHTGKGLFARHIIEELQRRGNDLLLLGEGVNCQLPAPRSPEGKVGSIVKSLLWHFRTALKLLREKPANVHLSPTSYIVPWLLGRSFPCAVVIHDLIAFHDEPHDRKAKLIERLLLPRVLRTAKHLFTVSEATKRELLERFPKTDQKKITVVYEGPTIGKHEARSTKFETNVGTASDFGFPTSLFELRGTGRISDFSHPYILCIGTLCPRKNQLRLIQAYNALPETTRKRVRLILVGGRGWADEEIVRLAKSSPNVEWRGYVADAERDALLAGATVFAYPSLAEGFGLPVLDALSLGIPTLTSNVSSLPEVAGDAALLVAPESVEEIREGLLRLLLDETLRNSLREKGPKQAAKFSWARTVDLLLGALAKA